MKSTIGATKAMTRRPRLSGRRAVLAACVVTLCLPVPADAAGDTRAAAWTAGLTPALRSSSATHDAPIADADPRRPLQAIALLVGSLMLAAVFLARRGSGRGERNWDRPPPDTTFYGAPIGCTRSRRALALLAAVLVAASGAGYLA
jgi:hypothetical protein